MLTFYDVLFQAVEPPNEEAISSAVDLLYKVLFFLFINPSHEYIANLRYVWQS
jgi:hypothetical protein